MAYDLGIIIPVYRSRESVRLLVERLEAVFLPDIKIRICLVDDSDDEKTARYLERFCLRPEVTLIRLKGNYGQQAAVLCGLEHTEACRYYGTIDDDLEQPPEVLKELYELVKSGYDLAYGIPCGGGRPLYRRLGSGLRDLLFAGLLGIPKGIQVSSLRVMTRQTVKAACDSRWKQNGFFYLSAAAFLGGRASGGSIRAVNFPYSQELRYEGASGYRLPKLVRLYWDILWNYCLCRKKPGGRRRKEKPVYHIKNIIRQPKLMVLGGSNCQNNALKKAATLGIDTVLADYTKKPPAAGLAGIHVPASTFDVPACVKAARQYRVDGVMTLGTDQPVYTAACVSSACGLPALLSTEEAWSVTNKKTMKQILCGAGIPTAAYRLVGKNTKAEELKTLRSPLVIKPLDSQGQRGIFKLDTAEEILRHLPQTLSYSRCEEALAEEFYQSDEVTVSGWVRDGRLYILTVTDRLLYPDSVHIGVCTGHRFPSVHMDQYEEIAGISERIVEAFRLKNGPFYLQLLTGDEGIRVNELASRIGGAFEDVFIPFITGFDILQAVLDSAMGKTVPVEGLTNYRADKSDKRIALQLLFCRPGEIGAVTPLEEIRKLPFILDAGYNYGPGQQIPVMENATARFGHAVIWGTRENIEERVDEFYRRLSVTSTDGREMLCRFYP